MIDIDKIKEKVNELQIAKKYEALLSLLTNSVLEKYNREDLYIIRGIANKELSKFNEAIEDFNKAIEINSSNEDSYLIRSQVYLILGDLDKSLIDLDKISAANKESSFTHNLHGTIYYKKGEFYKAIEYFEKSIELENNKALYHFNKGTSLLHLDELEKAELSFTEAINLKDDYLLKALTNRAATRVKKGELQAAINDYNQIIQIEPDNSGNLIERAKTWSLNNENQKAIDDLNKAIEIESNNAEAYYFRGLSFFQLGDHLNAPKDFKSATRFDKLFHAVLEEKIKNAEENLRSSNIKTLLINDFEAFISEISTIGKSNRMNVFIEQNDDGSPKVNKKGAIILTDVYPDSCLFRGQSGNFKLIPKIGREKKRNNERREKELIEEVKRRGDRLTQKGLVDEWELLVYVQHFGLETRLLDWTTNPLVALWFACENENEKEDAYVYVLDDIEYNLVDLKAEKNPFEIANSKILKPNFNNPRIIAQNGWFTVHNYDEKLQNFVALDDEPTYIKKMWRLVIPGKKKKIMLRKLDMVGINFEVIYQGIEGTCKYLNWK